MINGVLSEFTTPRIPRLPELDMPRVLVAAPTEGGGSRIAQAMRAAGYVVSTTGTDIMRLRRSLTAIELLVLDASEATWTLAATIEAVRRINWALPIVVLLRGNSELRAEVERLGVEAILEAPIDAEALRRVATNLVPVVPAAEFDMTG